MCASVLTKGRYRLGAKQTVSVYEEVDDYRGVGYRMRRALLKFQLKCLQGGWEIILKRKTGGASGPCDGDVEEEACGA